MNNAILHCRPSSTARRGWKLGMGSVPFQALYDAAGVLTGTVDPSAGGLPI